MDIVSREQKKMAEQKQVVLLTGASGSMGFETFRLLWAKRDLYDPVLLLRPSKRNKKLFMSVQEQFMIL